MSEQTYNGWTNRATWNAVLWIANDERLYKSWRAQSIANNSRTGKVWTEELVRFFLRLWWPDGKTPDGCDWETEANLQEIADAWDEEAKEDTEAMAASRDCD